jgi:hypothetical protein
MWLWPCVLMLASCSPALNWRQVAHEGAPVQALLPCKPERAEREVPLLGPQAAALTLQLMGCEAGGLSFAFGVLRLPDGADANVALAHWRQAAWASLQQALPTPATSTSSEVAPPGWASVTFAPRGAAKAEHWRGPGRDHLGRPLRADIAWSVQGPWVVQVAVYGEADAPEAREAFLSGLSWR